MINLSNLMTPNNFDKFIISSVSLYSALLYILLGTPLDPLFIYL